LIGSEEEASGFGPTGSDEAGDREDFALSEDERNGLNVFASAEVTGF
jgi:hypothetical protein